MENMANVTSGLLMIAALLVFIAMQLCMIKGEGQ